VNKTTTILIGVALSMAGVIGSSAVADDAREGFGRQWVRNNPLTFSAANASPSQWVNSGGLPTYLGANMTAVWAPGYDPSYSVAESVSAGAPLHVFLPAIMGDNGDLPMYDQVKALANPTAWMVGDEPLQTHFQNYKAVADYLALNDPSALRYINACSADGDSALWWGDNTNPSYTYTQYLEDLVTTIKPDVLMYDAYPFRKDGTTHENILFSSLLQVRSIALSHNLPYWTWIQSFADDARRLSSESDMRMQMFSHLTAGYTGFNYWTYTIYEGPTGQSSGLLDGNSQPSSAYYMAAEVNLEAKNLGQALRYLTSTDVRFIAGQTGGVGNTPPGGLSDWQAGTGGDSHLLSVNIMGSDGVTQNGLIGFFTADDGQIAFMLSNLNHGENLSSANTAMTFLLTFDGSITELLTIDRLTGLQQVVPLDNHTLSITLPGGTGNLYKYNTGNFVVPEPTTLAVVVMGFMALSRGIGRRSTMQ
jgi:hypothetical protein